jgi:hypothetical protein
VVDDGGTVEELSTDGHGQAQDEHRGEVRGVSGELFKGSALAVQEGALLDEVLEGSRRSPVRGRPPA